MTRFVSFTRHCPTIPLYAGSKRMPSFLQLLLCCGTQLSTRSNSGGRNLILLRAPSSSFTAVPNEASHADRGQNMEPRANDYHACSRVRCDTTSPTLSERDRPLTFILVLPSSASYLAYHLFEPCLANFLAPSITTRATRWL